MESRGDNKWGGGGPGERGEKAQRPVTRQTSTRDTKHSVVATVDAAVGDTWQLLGLDAHRSHRKGTRCVRLWGQELVKLGWCPI